jgi:hypothetical protein
MSVLVKIFSIKISKLINLVRFRLHSALISSTTKLHQFFQNCSDSVDDTEWLLESSSENPFEGVSFERIVPHL